MQNEQPPRGGQAAPSAAAAAPAPVKNKIPAFFPKQGGQAPGTYPSRSGSVIGFDLGVDEDGNVVQSRNGSALEADGSGITQSRKGSVIQFDLGADDDSDDISGGGRHRGVDLNGGSANGAGAGSVRYLVPREPGAGDGAGAAGDSGKKDKDDNGDDVEPQVINVDGSAFFPPSADLDKLYAFIENTGGSHVPMSTPYRPFKIDALLQWFV